MRENLLHPSTPKVRLVPQSIVNYRNEQYLVERKLNDRWWMLNTKTNEPLHQSDEELAQLQAAGQFYVETFPGQWSPDRNDPNPLNVGEAAHKENCRKLDYVDACLKSPEFSRSRRVLIPIIAAVALRRGDQAPSFTTLLNWLDAHEKYFSQYGAAALSSRHQDKGRRGPRLPLYQERAIEHGIQFWLKRSSKVAAYASVVDFARKYNGHVQGNIDKLEIEAKWLDERGLLRPPSRRTFERRCNAVDPRLSAAMRVGLNYAKQKFRTYTTMPRPDRPYAHVQIDHYTLDLQLVHPGGLILGRPDLLIFLDQATAMVIGYGLGFEQPSYASFLAGLRHAMYPKDMSRFPNVKSKWPCYGRIENLYHDNAFHFVGDNIRDAARNLGFNLNRMQPKEPWTKGSIERFFRTLNMQAVHRLPGATLSNVVARRENENLDKPTLTVEQFEHFLNIWICDVYNASDTRGLGFIRGFGGISPIEAWREKVRNFEVDQLPSRDLFVALAGDVSMRTIQRNGITLDHIIYEHPKLAKLLGDPKHRQKSIHGRSTKYKVVRDPSDLGTINILNPTTGEAITVPATTAHLPYAKGLTLTEHQIICARERENENKASIESLMSTKARLNEIAAKLQSAPGFKTTQRRLASFLNKDLIRPLRSKIDSFPPPGRDYLADPPEQISRVDLGAVAQSPSTVASQEIRYDPPQVDQRDTDLNFDELREQKDWENGYD